MQLLKLDLVGSSHSSEDNTALLFTVWSESNKFQSCGFVPCRI